MDPIAIDLKVVQIHWYSITMLTAILLGSYLFLKEAKKNKIDPKFLDNLLFYGIIIAIIGARLYYCLFNLDYYLARPIEILYIWQGGLAIHGGILFGAIWFIYYSKKNKISPLKILDIVAPYLILGQAIGRWGNFFNQEAHGPITSKIFLHRLLIPNFIINGMLINGNYYHPTFYYEFLWNILGFIILTYIQKKHNSKEGTLTGLYLSWYSIVRFIIESLRTDSLMLGSIKVAQLVSVILFIIGLILIFRKKGTKKDENRL